MIIFNRKDKYQISTIVTPTMTMTLFNDPASYPTKNQKNTKQVRKRQFILIDYSYSINFFRQKDAWTGTRRHFRGTSKANGGIGELGSSHS